MSPHLLSGAARLAGTSLMRAQSDERLVALVRDGHDPAFASVVERYRSELLRYATRIVGEDRAEDVVQQAFVNAHGALSSSSYDVALRPWLYRIVHNAALNVLRTGRRETELDEHLAALTSVEDEHDVRERLREALTAVALLPQPQRDALTLQAIEQRSHAEIADALGVSPGAARQHLHRARATVRAAVSAVTPYGLLARFALAEGGGSAVTGTIAGAGAGATLVKVGAGVLAAGALLGAGAPRLGLVPHHHRAAKAATADAAVSREAGASVAAGQADAGAATGRATPVALHRGGRGPRDARRHGHTTGLPGLLGSTGSKGAGSSGSGNGSSSGDGSSSGSKGSGENHGGSAGSGDHHGGSSGSGSSGSGSSGPGSGSSGSGSSGSGSSGSGSSGSDDGSSHDDTTLIGGTGGESESLVSGTSGSDDGTSGDTGTSGGTSGGSGSSDDGTSGGGTSDDGGTSGGGGGTSGGGSSGGSGTSSGGDDGLPTHGG